MSLDRLLGSVDAEVARILDRALDGGDVGTEEASRLLRSEGPDFAATLMVADELRRRAVGDRVSFVNNRNINFTNVCVGTCRFCAFRRSPGDVQDAYLLSLEQIAAKASEARSCGATEVCIQGGLNPDVEPDYYLRICEAVKHRVPDMHIHAFSPMEVLFASRRKGCSVEEFLRRLKASGLDSMPGTAAEILVDEVRRVICPQKLSVEEWSAVISTAHRLGIPTTATMMYGHVERPEDRGRHLQIVRDLQRRGGRFTEFVPLRFIHQNTQLYRSGLVKTPLSAVEDLKVHAVSRIVLDGVIGNIQVSWVKLGTRLAQVCLDCGVNDLGGTLMEENISRSAGADSPQSLTVEELAQLVTACGRTPVRRSTVYEVLEELR